MADRIPSVSVTTGWVSLPDMTAFAVSVLNNTGADLLLRLTPNPTEVQTLKDGQSTRLSPGTGNAKGIQISAAVGAAGVQLTIHS